MRRVISIDGVILDHPLFIDSEFDIDNYIGERRVAIDGSSVMFIQPKGAFTKEVQLTSNTTGWQKEATKDSLIDIVNEEPKIIYFTDGSFGTYYFDLTATPLIFTPLYEGSVWYNVEINLIKG